MTHSMANAPRSVLPLVLTLACAPWITPAAIAQTAVDPRPASPAVAPQQEDPTAESSEDDSVPPLSIRTLFHPRDRFEYFGPPPTQTHWLGDGRLVVREDDQWQVLDPASGEQSPWDFPATLREALSQLSGLSERAIEGALRSSLPAVDSLETPTMIRIGDALAVVGGEHPPRLVTRDARAWDTPELSPDGSAVAFVRDHDLYVIRVSTGELLRLTKDGSPVRLNGRLDWTYQEEIYGRGNFKGFWWSPDSQRIAFLSIDISNVLPYTLTKSETPRGEALVARYPKAGDPIPLATLAVVDVESQQVTSVHTPQGDEAESLVVRVTWRPEGGRLTYQIQNRVQTWLELRESDLSTEAPRVLLREEGPAWVEILGEPIWLPGGEFLWLSDLPAGRRHLWRVSEDGSRRIPITSGDWDVREVVRVLGDSRVAFVTGDQARGSRGQQLYRVHWGEGSQGPESAAPLTDAPGWHAPDVAPDGQWFVDTFSTLTREPVKTLVSVSGNTRRPLGEEDAADAAPWKSLDLPEPEWLEIVTEDGVPLPAYIIPPHAKADSGDERFPVLVYTYGGPLAAVATDRWSGRNYLFHHLLASEGIGVLVVDNRSSGGRGIADTWSIHRRMGVQELEDLLDAVEHLKSLDWVDGNRLAMRGWSFGGYYTAYAMTRSRVFAAGIAGGTVTDWRNYDAFYTERYMDTPGNNEQGYRDTSVLDQAGDLHGRLLLIHGEIDDNVHPANTLQLVAALQRSGKQFDLMFYPGAAHGVGEPRQVFHLYTLMHEFLLRELGISHKLVDQ